MGTSKGSVKIGTKQIAIFFAVALSLVMALLIVFYGVHTDVAAAPDNGLGKVETMDGWRLLNGDMIELPLSADGDTLTVQKVMTSDGSGKMMYFDSRGQGCEVTLNGLPVFSYGADIEKDAVLLGNYNTFINLPDYSTGDVLKISLIAREGSAIMTPAKLGSSGAVVGEIVRKSIMTIVFTSTMLILALLLLIIPAILKQKQDSFGRLACFALLAAAWMFSDSDLVALMLGTTSTAVMIKFFSFMLLPLPVFTFVRSYVLPKYKRFCTMLMFFSMGVSVLNIILHYTGAARFQQTLILTHIVALIAMPVMFVLLLLTSKQDKSVKGMRTSFDILFIASAIGIAVYYITGMNMDHALIVFQAGLLIFVGAMITTTLRQNSHNEIRALEADRLKQLNEQLARVNETVAISSQRFKVAAASLADMIFECDLRTDKIEILHISDSAPIDTSFAEKGMKAWQLILHNEDMETPARALDRIIAGANEDTYEARVHCLDGSDYRWYRITSRAIRGADGKPVKLLVTLTDTGFKPREEELPLESGIITSSEFSKCVSRQLLSHSRVSAGMLLFELDGLSDIIRTHGADEGEKAIERAKSILARYFRISKDGDLMCRYGKSCLAVWMTDAVSNRELIVRRLTQANTELSAPGVSGIMPTTMSAGVAFASAAGDFGQLCAHSEQALAMAKTQGSSRCVFWSAPRK